MKKVLSLLLTAFMVAASFAIGGVTKPAAAQDEIRAESNGDMAPVYEAYFAEGYTGGSFQTWLLLLNPNEQDAEIEVQYLQEGQDFISESYTLPANSRYTIFVNEIVEGNVSLYVKSTNSVEFFAERAMYWNNGAGGHVSNPTTSLSPDWYFAEGYSGPGFDEYLLLANPTDEDVSVMVSLLKSDGTTIDNEYDISAKSRKTIYVNDIMTGENSIAVYQNCECAGNIVAERAMYWNNMRGGHDTIGAQSPSSQWYFAEGYATADFEEWLLLGNPYDSDSEVTINYVNLSGDVVETEVTVPALSRKTIRVNDILSGENSIEVEVISGPQIVAERAMYWKNRDDGHVTIGVESPGYLYYLPEGYTAESFDEYVLALNPNDQDTNVLVVIFTPEAVPQVHEFALGAHSRLTVHIDDYISGENSVLVISDQGPIVVERAMYWNNMGGGHDAVGQQPSYPCFGLQQESTTACLLNEQVETINRFR